MIRLSPALSLSAILLSALIVSGQVIASDEWGDDEWGEEESSRSWHGFYELGLGGRAEGDPALEDHQWTLAELRARLESETYIDDVRFSGKADLYADGVDGGFQVNLRQAIADISLTDNLDMRIGQQVLTWGTGDLLFLNDLFAKDWISFFSGRDDEYLKAPSASIKLAYYSDLVNIDFVWTPKFTHDQYIEGERFSYFSPLAGGQQGTPDGILRVEEPEEGIADGEFALRFHGQSSLFGDSSTEWAVYGYKGYWKQPNAVNQQLKAYFSPLHVVGVSLRRNLFSGIGYSEYAWFNGADDQGNNPMQPNNQHRLLFGYEQELIPKLTLGVQYYIEHQADYSQLVAADGDSPYRPDQNRQLWTVRATYRALQDNLILNWFSFYSPTDDDYYHRPSAKYRFDDQLSLTVGANLFGGSEKHTFFAQFEDASNLYARLRWSY